MHMILHVRTPATQRVPPLLNPRRPVSHTKGDKQVSQVGPKRTPALGPTMLHLQSPPLGTSDLVTHAWSRTQHMPWRHRRCPDDRRESQLEHVRLSPVSHVKGGNQALQVCPQRTPTLGLNVVLLQLPPRGTPAPVTHTRSVMQGVSRRQKPLRSGDHRESWRGLVRCRPVAVGPKRTPALGPNSQTQSLDQSPI